VRPFAQLSRINQNDVIDLIYSAIVYINRFFHHLLSATQTGRLRWYAAAIVFGGFITVTIILFL
jgi:NADH-quinone oxidoreductase subunit L